MSGYNNTVDAPGAFPATPAAEEPLQPQQQSSHNKLHKRDDPRATGGMTEPTGSSRGHYFTGSGGAVDDAPAQSQYSQPSDRAYNNENTSSIPSEATNNDFNNTARSTEDEPASGIVRNGLTEKSTAGNENAPYWGSIPSGGVHNSVIGHGSNEDDGHNHERTTAHDNYGRAMPSHHREFPLVDHKDTVPSGGVYNTVTGHGSTEDSQRPTTRELSDNNQKTSTLADRSRNSELPNQRDETTTDSHYGRDSGMALAGATTAYAAHDRHNKHDQRVAEDEQPKEKKESKLAALFHRDHEDKEKEHKPTKVEHERHLKDEQPHEKKESKLASLFHSSSGGKDDPEARKIEERKHEPIASHASDPRDRHQHETLAAAPTTQHSTQEPGYVQQPEDKHHDRHYGGAAAATGAGLGAAYGAHRYANRSEPEVEKEAPYATTENVSSSSYVPTSSVDASTLGHSHQRAPADSQYDTSNSGVPSGLGSGERHNDHHYGNAAATGLSQSQRHTPKDSQYDTLQSGVPSGVATGDSHNDDRYGTAAATGLSSQSQRHTPAASQYDTLRSGVPSGVATGDSHNDGRYGTAAATGSNQSQKYGAGEPQYDTLQSGVPSGVATEDRHNDHHYGTTAAATGAGLGAAYGAHRYANRDESETERMAPTSTTQREAMSSVAPTSTAGHTDLSNSQYRTPQESKYDNLKDGMHRGVPTGTSRTQANVGRGSTDSSHGGQYDVLSSGTPSGVHINDHPTSHISSNAKSFEQERKQSTYLSNTSPIKTSSSKAVAPRGPYSHEYEQKDDYNNGRAISNMEQAAQGAAQKKVQEEPTSATRQMVAEDGYGSASKPIIHNCVNCGHGNDISRYFKS